MEPMFTLEVLALKLHPLTINSRMMALLFRLLLSGKLLLTVQIVLGTVLVEAQNTSFGFTSFSTEENFLMVGDVQYDANKSSFLMNARAAAMLTDNCGRLLYNNTVRMKDSKTGAVASFHTAFTFLILAPNNHYFSGFGYAHGDGLAFSFARTPPFKGENGGGSLCLIKAKNNGIASNNLFAVEFDTFPNYLYDDISDSHIGVDINSMNSTWYYNLCGKDVYNCSYLCNGGYFTAWIDYDSASQKLEVFFTNGSLYTNIQKPPKPVINANVSLPQLLDDYMYVGFTSSTGQDAEIHEIRSWTFTSSGMPDAVAVQQPPSPAPKPPPESPPPTLTRPHSTSSHTRTPAVAGISAGAVAASVVALGFLIARRRWRTSWTKQASVGLVDGNHLPRAFTYKELTKATKGFSRSELLGSGGFGAVYKGTLPSGALVAVKRMRMESKHGKESFQAEVASLSHIRHRNLVQLRGWCHDEGRLLLVYDYMRNGSLDEWLFPSSDSTRHKALPPSLRHSVLSGVAAALAYLHEECAQCVLHRDIKSSNVLLDGQWNAYLGDFGLARVIDHQKMEKTTAMAGTFGYMAPELPHTWRASKESDVYSFGVLVLEVMCRRRPLEMRAVERGEGILVDMVWQAHEAGDILGVGESSMEVFSASDENSSNIFGELERLDTPSTLLTHGVHDGDSLAVPDADAAVETTRNLLHLGLLCCNPNPEDRPSICLVSQWLQSLETMEMSLPALPGCKPESYFSWPGFSDLGMPLWGSLSSNSPNVEAAPQGASLLILSTQLSGEHRNMQTSRLARPFKSLRSNW